MAGSPHLREEAQLRDQRLVSLDALRGFDMFWIIGGSLIVGAAADVTGWTWLAFLKRQFTHTYWDGFTPYDLIFPLFLFIAGVSMPFSFDKRRANGESKLQLAQHVIIRGLILVLLGMVFNGLLKFNWSTLRCASVLGRIGLAYLFAGLIVLNTNVRGQLMWFIGVLVGYWAAMKFIPVPGYGAGDLAPGHNLADYIDSAFLPGAMLHPDQARDPEGLLSTVPAIGTALAGALTGRYLKTGRYTGYQKSAGMAIVGAMLFGLAWLWNIDFPVNKNLWSSSFVLNCAGLSLMLLALFYLVVDVWGLRSWAMFFVVIGSNSILIYMAPVFVDFGYTSKALFDGALGYTGIYRPLLFAISVVAVKWLLLMFLYRRRIFLRV